MPPESSLDILRRHLARHLAARGAARAFAKSVGYTPQALSMVLNGQRGLSADKIDAIAHAMGVRAADLFREADVLVAPFVVTRPTPTRPALAPRSGAAARSRAVDARLKQLEIRVTALEARQTAHPPRGGVRPTRPAKHAPTKRSRR